MTHRRHDSTADFLRQEEDRLDETLVPEESEMFKNRQKLGC